MKAHGMHGCGPHGRRRERERARDRRPARLETPEERAEAKIEATGDAIRWSAITIALLIFIPPVGFIVLFLGGAKHLQNLYRLVIEPKLRQRFIDREVRRQVSATLLDERQQMVGEHARSMETLSASIAHEIRNPITAAKSLVQQMGEDPLSVENVEYANVALSELDRVERSISHLLKYAKEEDYSFAPVNVASVVDSALTQMRGKLETAKIAVVRNYITGPTVLADGDKLHPVQEQFIEHDAMQCGFCTPGMIMSCAALLERNKQPTLDDVRTAVSGNLCRCGTYPKVFDATLAAAKSA